MAWLMGNVCPYLEMDLHDNHGFVTFWYCLKVLL